MTGHFSSSKPAAKPSPRWLPVLLASDLAAIVAVLLIHFLTKSTESTTTVALTVIGLSGLLVLVPVLALFGGRKAEAETGGKSDESLTAINAMRTDFRLFTEYLEKCEKHTAAQLSTLTQSIAEIRTTLDALKTAAPAQPAKFPALGEIANQLSTLTSLAGDDGEIQRLRALTEEVQSQLETLTDSIRSLENGFRENNMPAAAVERDGPLPPSLMAKALPTSTPSFAGGAMGRIINKAAAAQQRATSRYATGNPNTNPVEDEVWDTATDMADDDAPYGADAPDAAPPPDAAASTSAVRSIYGAEVPPSTPSPAFAPDALDASPDAPSAPAPDAPPPPDAVPPATTSAVRSIYGAEVPPSTPSPTSAPATPDADAPTADPFDDDDAPPSEAITTTPPPAPPAETTSSASTTSVVPAQTDLLRQLGLVPDSELPPRRSGKKAQTVLIANIVTGLGAKPYVRGSGPGLNDDIGEPMEPVAIGRWQWIAPDNSRPVHATIWKNDIIRASGAPVHIAPGGTAEVFPEFPA